MELYPLLVIKENFVPNNIINLLLNFDKAENICHIATVRILSNDGNTVSETTNENRKTKIIEIPNHIINNIKNTIFTIHELYLKKIYNSKIKNIENPQFLRYDIEDHYIEHNDCEDFVNNKIKKIIDRDISVIIFLNDNYEGGELEFTNLQLSIKPKAGMMIAFPSYMEFSHKVHKVTKGTRYSIVSWINTENTIYNRPYDYDR